MGRTRLVRTKIDEIKKRIQTAEKTKKEYINYLYELQKRYAEEKISYSNYLEATYLKRYGKNIQEWINYLEDYIKDCKKLIKKNRRKTIKNNLVFLIFSSVFLFLLISLSFYIQPGLTGFLVLEQEIPETISEVNVTLTTTQQQAILGQPVKWIKTISLDKPSAAKIRLPVEAANISVNKITESYSEENSEEALLKEDSSPSQEEPSSSETKANFRITGAVISETQEGFLLKFFRNAGRITGLAIKEPTLLQEIEINDTATEYEIEYETPAPYAIEEEIERGKRGKRVKIIGPDTVHYENVLAFTNLDESLNIRNPSRVRIHWIENNSFVPIQNIRDTDNNGVYDYIEWQVQSLSEQTFEIIIIAKAEHLDSNREFISDIYEKVKTLDDVWSEEIPNKDYVRVTFEIPLDSSRDITIYPRVISGSPRIEVYEVGSDSVIAEFTNIKSNEYNKVLLTNLQGAQDVFDLRILDGSLEIDYIVDPSGATVTTVTSIPRPTHSFSIEQVGDFDAHVLILNNTGNNPDYKYQFLTNGLRLFIDRKQGFGFEQLISEVQLAPEYKKQQGTPGSFIWNSYGLNINTVGSNVLQGWNKQNQADGSVKLIKTFQAFEEGIEENLTEIWIIPSKTEEFGRTGIKTSINMTKNRGIVLKKGVEEGTWRIRWALSGISNIFSDNNNIKDENGVNLRRKSYNDFTIDWNDFDNYLGILNGVNYTADYTFSEISANNKAELLAFENGTTGNRILDPTLVVSGISTGWNHNKQRIVFYNGADFFLFYTKADGSIYYNADADNIGTWDKGETVLLNDQDTTDTDFDIYLINDTKFDLIYKDSSLNVKVVTVNIAGQILSNDTSSTITTGVFCDGVISSMSIVRNIFANRIYASCNDDLVVFGLLADQLGDSSNITSWADRYSEGSTIGQVTLITFNDFDSSFIIFQRDAGGVNNDGIYSREYSPATTPGKEQIGNLDNIGDLANAIRINDTDFRYILTKSGAVMEEYKYDGTSWTLNETIDTETDQISPSLFYEPATGDLYAFSIDNGTDDVERHKKPSGGSWGTEVVVDDGESASHSFPITQMHEPPYNSNRTTPRELVWAYRVANGSNFDLKVGNLTLATGADTFPQWFDNSTNSTIAGAYIEHRVKWTDDTALSGYIFSFDNGTGIFTNDSFVEMTGVANWSNVSKSVNITVGSTIQWRVYANDSANQLNSTDIFSYNTTSANAAPTITFVEAISAVTPNESGVNYTTFNFTVTDTDGGGTINFSTAEARFQLAGETTRLNTTCINTTGAIGNDLNFTCTIGMWYFDKADSNWIINVTVKDNSDASGENSSTSFQYNSLSAMVISPTALAWTEFGVTATNTGSNNDPIILNNTGNAESLSINVTGLNLQGETTATQFIFAANLTVENVSQGCTGTQMLNATSLNVTSTILQRGNNSLNNNNATSGQEELFFCITAVNSDLTAQSYSSAAYGAWEIKILLVVAAIPARKRRKKGKKSTIGELSIPVTIFSRKLGTLETLCKYLKENLGMSYSEIAKELNRDQRTIWTAYKKAVEKQREIIEVKKTLVFLPVSILADRKLTTLESIVHYLKKKELKNSEIAKLLDRDQRNIWTIYSKAVRKLKKEEIRYLIEIKAELSIPATIFSKKLGGLEAITKYMKENLKMDYHEIAGLLNRDQRTIWTAYKKAIGKQKAPIEIEKTLIFLPISILRNRKLTILESIIVYLKEREMKYSEIAKLLDRDQRNIWTIYSRTVIKKKKRRKK